MSIDATHRKTTALGIVLRIVFGLFVLAVVVGGGGSFYLRREFQRNRAALNSEVQRIRSLGEPLDGAGLNAYCQIPAGETDLTRVYLDALAPFIGQKRPLQKIGTVKINDLDVGSVPLRPETWILLVDAEHFLADYDKLLSDLVAAGKHRGSVRYPVDFSLGFALKYDMPMVVNDARNLLFLRALCEYHRGNFENAADSVIAQLRLADSLQLDPTLFAQLCRQTAYEGAAATVVLVASDPEFPAAELARLQEALSAGNFDQAFLRAAIGERVMAYQAMQLPLEEITGTSKASASAPSIADSRPGDSAMLLHLRSLSVETGKLPWDEGLASNLANRTEILAEKDADKNRLQWNRNVVTSLAGATSLPFFEIMLRTEAERRSAVTICAIERFQRERGALPGSLEELMPDFLAAVLIDPVNRQPLRFVRSGAGYKVYSLGVNKFDDGGDFNRSRDAADFGFTMPRKGSDSPVDFVP